MDELFSHAPQATPAHGTAEVVDDVRAHVPQLPEQAAEGFTDYLHLWWPVGIFSLAGPGSHVWWDERGCGEEAETGEVHVWGRTLRWDWPRGAEAELTLANEQRLSLSVMIEASGQGSTVLLRATRPEEIPAHPGREGGEAPRDVWEQVLGFYARFMGGSVLDDA